MDQIWRTEKVSSIYEVISLQTLKGTFSPTLLFHGRVIINFNPEVLHKFSFKTGFIFQENNILTVYMLIKYLKLLIFKNTNDDISEHKVTPYYLNLPHTCSQQFIIQVIKCLTEMVWPQLKKNNFWCFDIIKQV